MALQTVYVEVDVELPDGSPHSDAEKLVVDALSAVSEVACVTLHSTSVAYEK